MFWPIFLIAQEHYQDLLREAEEDRLIKRALAARPKHIRLHCQAWSG